MNNRLSVRWLTSPLCVGFVLLLAASTSTSVSQPRLDPPSANMAIDEAVPFALVQQIAAVKAKQVFGEGALGAPIPLSDAHGDLVAWMFSYRIGGTTFPSYGEILQHVKAGRDLKNLVARSAWDEARQLHQALLEEDARKAPVSQASAPVSQDATPSSQAAASVDQSTADHGGLGQIDPVRADGSRSKRARGDDVRAIRKYALARAVGAGDFGTIVVSATYAKVPVPAYLHYLAPYYSQFDQALERARALIGDEATLRRLYFFGLRGQYFEFASGSASVVLHAQTLQSSDIVSSLAAQEAAAQPLSVTPGGRAQIAA